MRLFGDKKKQAIEHLVELIEATDNHLNSGVMGYRFVLNILADNGYVDFAYKLITQKTWPSWGNLIKQGATTLWETFTEFVHTERGIEQKMDSNRLWSLNHSCFGGVSTWFYNYVAGIKVKSAKVLEISPNFITGLESASASFENLGNKISVSWKKENEKYTVEIINNGFDADVIQLKPKVCVVMIGVNDVDKIDALANKMVIHKGNYEALIAYIKTTFVNKMFSMYKKILLKAKKKKIKIIVCSVTPHNHNLDAGTDYRNTYILGLNEKLKELAKELEFDYVDYNSKVRDDNGLFSLEYSWDRLHPNVKGYNLMSEILKPYLLKNLEG